MDAKTSFGVTEPAPTVIGQDGLDGQSPHIKQGYDDTCAIRSQEIVLRDFGINVTEDELREQAIAHDWYRPGSGTSPEDVGNLLELHGVEVNRYEHANIFTLTNELAQGNRVIIGVDSGELWDASILEQQEDANGIKGADHALVVSGIDTSDPNNIKVVLTDPGSGDIAKEYPIEQFIDAWEDSDFFMVSTVDPAPLEFNPEMVNFDYSLGHIPEIGELSYDEFQHHFAPCMELELSDTVIKDQAELLNRLVTEENSDFPLYPTTANIEAAVNEPDASLMDDNILLNDNNDSEESESELEVEETFEIENDDYPGNKIQFLTEEYNNEPDLFDDSYC